MSCSGDKCRRTGGSGFCKKGVNGCGEHTSQDEGGI